MGPGWVTNTHSSWTILIRIQDLFVQPTDFACVSQLYLANVLF